MLRRLIIKCNSIWEITIVVCYYDCTSRETVRTVNWHETSFSRSTPASFLKATPTSSASTCSGRSTRTTAARSTSKSSYRRSTSRRRAGRNRSSSGRLTCTTSTATARSNPARCPKLSEYVHLQLSTSLPAHLLSPDHHATNVARRLHKRCCCSSICPSVRSSVASTDLATCSYR